MGLFDFLRRKERDESDDAAKQPGGEPPLREARPHHYLLAHYALRSIAFQQPLGFLGVLASPDKLRFLAEALRQVTENCKQREAAPDFSIDDITVHNVRAGPFPCAVIEMPQPKATTEAFFAAAVVLVDAHASPPPDPAGVTLRYFTLEKGIRVAGGTRTVLCEWTAAGTHCNYGDGPEPHLGAFISAIEALLAKSQPK